MGISLIPGLFLARNAVHVAKAANGVILGRQKIHMPPRKLRRFVEAVQARGIALSEADLAADGGWSDTLLRRLGYPQIESLDFTDAEGAAHIHDLNLPVPDALRERFDVVIDGGTTEHVFHIGQALESCHAMLRPGGLMLAYVAADGWFGHGFFQSGPDVPWRFWHHARGCEMLEVSIVPRKSPRKVIAIPDPTDQPRGGERFLAGPHMLLYACRKPLEPPASSTPVQGHYDRPADG